MNMLERSKNNPSPCLGCESRSLGCHSICDKYLSFKQSISKSRQEYNERFSKDEYFRERRKDNAEAHLKKMGSNKVINRYVKDPLEIFE